MLFFRAYIALASSTVSFGTFLGAHFRFYSSRCFYTLQKSAFFCLSIDFCQFSHIFTNGTKTVGKSENNIEKPCGNTRAYCCKAFQKKLAKNFFRCQIYEILKFYFFPKKCKKCMKFVNFFQAQVFTYFLSQINFFVLPLKAVGRLYDMIQKF